MNPHGSGRRGTIGGMAHGDLAGVTSVVVLDWPTKDVPDSLARAGVEVAVHGGPRPEDWSVQELGADGVTVVGRATGAPPDHAEVVYTHRPIDELPAVVALARQVGARTVWLHSARTPEGVRDATAVWISDEDRERARCVVEGAGLNYVDEPYIGDAARARS